MKFSANLGFLWTNRSLPDAIRAAKKSGFDAVECHYPYGTAAEEVRTTLSETNMEMLALNTRRGQVENGDNGLAALPGRETEARAAIDEAINYARLIGAKNIHVMAGCNQSDEGHKTYLKNLEYACDRAAKHSLTILIEPLNCFDVPGYFLRTTTQAAEIIGDIGTANLKLMFDCYHVGRTERDVVGRLRDLYSIIGHIQFASVPDRGTPDQGEVDYQKVFATIDAIGWQAPVGAEYIPKGQTDASLAWMSRMALSD